MLADNEFGANDAKTHGGVAFYGPQINGRWANQLVLSIPYSDPIFSAVYDRAAATNRVAALPAIVIEWRDMSGWWERDSILAIDSADAVLFASALGHLKTDDFASINNGIAAERLVRCARAVQRFFEHHLDNGRGVFIQSL